MCERCERSESCLSSAPRLGNLRDHLGGRRPTRIRASSMFGWRYDITYLTDPAVIDGVRLTPANCDRGPYSIFCGYRFSPTGMRQVSGCRDHAVAEITPATILSTAQRYTSGRNRSSEREDASCRFIGFSTCSTPPGFRPTGCPPMQ